MQSSQGLRRIGFALVLACIGTSNVEAQAPAADVIQRASRSRAKGVEGAPVLVFEIADFQCPYCAHFATEVYPRLDSAYVKTGKVQWVFVNLPLPNHARGWQAAEAAACAGAVSDRFWPMHDRLFGEQSTWSKVADLDAALRDYARDAGVAADAYDACVMSDQVAQLLIQDMLFASAAGVTGTPTFIIDKKEMVVGFKTFEEWQGIIEKALQSGNSE